MDNSWYIIEFAASGLSDHNFIFRPKTQISNLERTTTLFWIINCHSIMNEMPDCYLIIFAENLCLIWFLLSNICNVIVVFVVKAQVSISAQRACRASRTQGPQEKFCKAEQEQIATPTTI